MMTKPDFEKKQLLFVMLNEGEKVSFSNDNVVVKLPDSSIKYQVTCYRIFALFLVGHFTLTTGIIERSHKFGFPIILMTNSLKAYDIIGHSMEGNVLLRKQQYSYTDLDIGKHIIINKISNQQLALKKIRNKSDDLKMVIRKLSKCQKDLQREKCDLESIMGYEGMAARLYFRHAFYHEKWTGRRPRIKSDFINSTLDIGYTLLFNLIDSLVNLYGFDTYCGVLHRQFYMRKSLICDLVEPFRPIIDWQVNKAINLNQCSEKDFEVYNYRYVLKWKENPKYIKFLIAPLLENKLNIFQYIQDYYRAFMRQKSSEEFPVYIFI